LRSSSTTRTLFDTSPFWRAKTEPIPSIPSGRPRPIDLSP